MDVKDYAYGYRYEFDSVTTSAYAPEGYLSGGIVEVFVSDELMRKADVVPLTLDRARMMMQYFVAGTVIDTNVINNVFTMPQRDLVDLYLGLLNMGVHKE